MGTPAAAVPTLSRIVADGHDVAAVYCQPDRPSGRGQGVSFSPVKEFALANNLAVIQPEKIRTAEALETFSSHNADAAVVVAYGRILPEGFLTAFRHGAVNVHFSLLPKYRGAAPVNWAIAEGETETGVTTMNMDVGLDTGDVLLQRSTPIHSGETAIELTTRLADMGADLLSETLRNLEKIVPQMQDESLATHAPILKKPDGLLDWSLDAKVIANRIRGFQPFPSVYSFYKGKRVTFWRGEAGDNSDREAAPGTIIGTHGDLLIVQCGSGVLSVSELQIEGKRRMAARDFINGNKLAEGELFRAPA